MGDTWVIDLRHYDWSEGNADEIPREAIRLAEYFASIVESALRNSPFGAGLTGVQCRRRPGRKRCTGRIEAELTPREDELHWWCPECGDNGRISNWEGTRWDPNPRGSIGPERRPGPERQNVDGLGERIQGTIEWDETSPSTTPLIVSETGIYTWDELGRKLMTYEGYGITITVD